MFAQIIGIDQMISQMRFTHSQLLSDSDLIQQLVKSNNTAEAIT